MLLHDVRSERRWRVIRARSAARSRSAREPAATRFERGTPRRAFWFVSTRALARASDSGAREGGDARGCLYSVRSAFRLGREVSRVRHLPLRSFDFRVRSPCSTTRKPSCGRGSSASSPRSRLCTRCARSRPPRALASIASSARKKKRQPTTFSPPPHSAPRGPPPPPPSRGPPTPPPPPRPLPPPPFPPPPPHKRGGGGGGGGRGGSSRSSASRRPARKSS